MRTDILTVPSQLFFKWDQSLYGCSLTTKSTVVDQNILGEKNKATVKVNG